MKNIFTPLKSAWILALTLLLFSVSLEAQICSSPGTTIYGLTGTGALHSIDVTTGTTSAQFNPAYTGHAPDLSNALGYNRLNGRFYYFKRNNINNPQEFIVFNPNTNTYTALANCPSSEHIKSGAIASNGLGYYCIDAEAVMYYYHIATNTWTEITDRFHNQFGNNITNTIAAQSFGDIAFDGNGNLWILASGWTTYGLYRLAGPPPIIPVSSITLSEIIPPNKPTPDTTFLTGIAFNSTGQIFVASSYTRSNLYRLENNYTTTFLGVISVAGAGNDLTSCNYPMGVLPVTWLGFSAEAKSNQAVALKWTVGHQSNNKGFHIEHSLNGTEWETLGFVQGSIQNNMPQTFNYSHHGAAPGKHYYRLRQEDMEARSSYSSTQLVEIKADRMVSIWPNPTTAVLRIQNGTNPGRHQVKIFDQSGRIVADKSSTSPDNTIDIRSFAKGIYTVTIIMSNGETYSEKILKQ